MWAALHVGALAAPFFFHWSAVAAGAVLFAIAGCLGITMCYHRYLAHASFKTSRAMRFLMLLAATLSFFGGPIDWVGHHRRHHAHTDEPRDPHTPREGFWWAHFEWFFVAHPFAPERYARDLQRDKMCVFFERFWFIPAAGSLVLIFALGQWACGQGVSWLLWAGAVRSVVMLQVTGAVNSVAHRWGYRNFQTPDDSCNSRWLGLITFGEGFHNNHHAQQRSAAHGMLPGEIDLTYYCIRLLERVGIVWDVVSPSLSHAQAASHSSLPDGGQGQASGERANA